MQIIMPESLISEIQELIAAKRALTEALDKRDASAIRGAGTRIEFMETDICIACEALVLNATQAEKTNS